MSSSEVYNDVSSPKNNHEDSLIDVSCLSNYGLNKYITENYIKRNFENYLIIRLGGFVGNGLRKNAVFDLVNKRELFVSPNSEFQYMDVDETAKIILQMLKNGFVRETFNLSGVKNTNLKYIIDFLNLDLKDIHVKSDVYKKCEINVEKITKFFTIKSSTEYVKSYLENLKVI